MFAIVLHVGTKASNLHLTNSLVVLRHPTCSVSKLDAEVQIDAQGDEMTDTQCTEVPVRPTWIVLVGNSATCFEMKGRKPEPHIVRWRLHLEAGVPILIGPG